MTPESHAEAEPTLTESARQLLEAAGVDASEAECGGAARGPGPGDDRVMSWARAM